MQECADVPPLRLVHWSEIAKASELPKYPCPGRSGRRRPGPRSAAQPVEKLLDATAAHLAVPRQAAPQRLVVFLLSHRWLRTGSENHPDTEEHVKAARLQSFARWFMRLASHAGVPCDVAFWIDYCCCEQDLSGRLSRQSPAGGPLWNGPGHGSVAALHRLLHEGGGLEDGGL